MLAVSVRTLWRLVAAGKAPPPVRFNRRLVRWRRADLIRYFETLSPFERMGLRL